ncbi:MAG: cupin domain-containing protein [Planctomycetes bacterium]|nr:cupin domain-containing protein [Planctomycetota bacterium]
MERMERKSLGSPDETRRFTKGRMDVVSLGDLVVGRAAFEPGWRWSESVKQIVGTKSCQVDHRGYVIAGRMHIAMDDGTSIEVGPGDAFVCPPGHDAWVLGDEPCVMLEFSGAGVYARPPATAARR